MADNVFGLCVRAGWRDEVLSTRGERGAGYKTSNLPVTPPDAKPVLLAGVLFTMSFSSFLSTVTVSLCFLKFFHFYLLPNVMYVLYIFYTHQLSAVKVVY